MLRSNVILVLASVLLLGSCGGGGDHVSEGSHSDEAQLRLLKVGTPDITSTAINEAFSVGGNVSGLLSGEQLFILVDNTEPIRLTSNGQFFLQRKFAAGSNIQVSLGPQPKGKNCVLSGGDIQSIQGDVTSIRISCSTCTPQEARIVFDDGAQRISPPDISASGPRMIRLRSGEFLVAFSYDKDASGGGWVGVALRRSTAKLNSWSSVMYIDYASSKYWRTVNPSLVQLRGGDVLLTYVRNKVGDERESEVVVARSNDGGRNWNPPIIIAKGRAWEPFILELPNGILHAYWADETPYWGGSTLSQDIAMSSSFDGGRTWSAKKILIRKTGMRPGTPIATVSSSTNMIHLTYEVVGDAASPYITSTSASSGWVNSAPIDYSSPSSHPTNTKSMPVRAPGDWGGFPYLTELNRCVLLYGYHSGSGRTGSWLNNLSPLMVLDPSTIEVNSLSRVIPGGGVQQSQGRIIPSITRTSDDTLAFLVTSTTNEANAAIYMYSGKVVNWQSN